MLLAHFDAIEKRLVAQSGEQDAAGHPLHKGTPREVFIRDFLRTHISETVNIGTGEIIDANSSSGQKRNQHDIVIYNKNFPKLNLVNNISVFFIESVIATIEVKSRITKSELKKAVLAARNCKTLESNALSGFRTGYVPPKPLCYVVSYKGPSKMQTILKWMQEIYKSEKLICPDLPLDNKERYKHPASALDGVLVLEKGFMYYDNVPMAPDISNARRQNPNLQWCFTQSSSGNLLLFYQFLQIATQNIQAKWLNPVPYLKEFNVMVNFAAKFEIE